MPKHLRFHLLGLAHVPTNKEVAFACAYSMKIEKLARMLKSCGHEVYFYGIESSKVECDEFIQVSTLDLLDKVYGKYDYRKNFFKHNPQDEAHQTFNKFAIEEINKRKQGKDILLCPMGNYQLPISQGTGLMTCESGIGYSGVFSRYRVFESYAWMHYIYGLLKQDDGIFYDAVIPNYFDLADFQYYGPEKKENYLLYIGRIIQRKGVSLAAEVAQRTGNKLLVVGQGDLVNPSEGLDLTKFGNIIEHIPAVGPKERNEIMGKARCALCPTYYIGPFEGTAVENQLCGTPVITTDWGAFAETILHGQTGYRCRTMEHFIWAVDNIGKIKPEDCRSWAANNYSMERVALMYEEYFQSLSCLFENGFYQENPMRTELDWLKKYYPQTNKIDLRRLG